MDIYEISITRDIIFKAFRLYKVILHKYIISNDPSRFSNPNLFTRCRDMSMLKPRNVVTQEIRLNVHELPPFNCTTRKILSLSTIYTKHMAKIDTYHLIRYPSKARDILPPCRKITFLLCLRYC